MEHPKISVIIPVYKVEPYLRQCLDSVAGQSYRNLEIILVDDGSPDNCGAICDAYAARDGRFQVIHKQNGGLSSARNAGLRIATGEYLGFVDSDDWIDPEMYSCLMKKLADNGADIAVCGRYEEYPRESVRRGWQESFCLDTTDAIGMLLNNDILDNTVWDKLYKRNVFSGISFPEGQNYEDMAVMHKLFVRAERVVCIEKALYHYRQRGDSILADESLRNRVDHYKSARMRYDEMKGAYPQFEQILAAQCVASAVGIWSVYLSNPPEERRAYLPQLRQIAAFAKGRSAMAAECFHLGIAGKLLVYLVPYASSWAFGLAWLYSQLYRLKHGRAL